MMVLTKFKNISIICVMFYTFNLISGDQVGELPHCQNSNKPSLVIVSTLDGKLSAIDKMGNLLWNLQTDPGPLFLSNIHQLELTNNGQWIRIIPSLSGKLYKFDGVTVDPIPITAESLLKSSFRYSDDLVIAGGIDVHTYGIQLHAGKILYECSQVSCKNITGNNDGVEDILVVERTTQVIRAIEPKTGNERWNFSVGLNDIKLSQTGCVSLNGNNFSFNITASRPEGLVIAYSLDQNSKILWQYKFETPIVNIWQWNGGKLSLLNLFQMQETSGEIVKHPSMPAIYIGMYNKQLYIHELSMMHHTFQVQQVQQQSNLEIGESRSLIKIPWKPISATRSAAIAPIDTDASTALSVLYGSEYVNGQGYYLYTEEEKKSSLFCDKNITISVNSSNHDDMLYSVWRWWKEVIVISITTAVVINIMCKSFERTQRNQEIIYVERHVEIPAKSNDHSSSGASDSSAAPFTSRYVNDFDTVRCLGKGGFGIVFEVKQKIDECRYAIKRITLPQESNSRTRVLREVKALAKLDHNNIVRYFNSWVEDPPVGWQREHDKNWEINEVITFGSTTTSNQSSLKPVRSASVVVEVPDTPDTDNSMISAIKDDDSDSFIVFENSQKSSQEDNLIKTNSSCATEESSLSNNDNVTYKIVRNKHQQRPNSLEFSKNLNAPKQLNKPVFLYIQMQLCQKESLRDWLKNNVDRDFNYILDIFRQIISAVEYVHGQGLIHRDLKPSNIFFSLEGRIKVGDFGLVTDMQDCMATELASLSPVRGHTKAVGTYLYMSPEQYKGEHYNYKVDIYSLGLIFFELIVPFSTEMERINTLNKLKDKIYPKNFKEQYTKEYELLNMMLSKNPNERPTAIDIKARPPLNEIIFNNMNYHFEMPRQKKNSE